MKKLLFDNQTVRSNNKQKEEGSVSNGIRAAHREKKLTKRLENGKAIHGFSPSGAPLRRLAHKINRRVVREKLPALIAAEAEVSVGIVFTGNAVKTSIDWMPMRARECGAVHVTTTHVFFL